jgi:putative hydrolase of the HAD superfamily
LKKKYKHLFFDLDRTLWDFEKSAVETFAEVYVKYNLQERGVTSLESFIASYTCHNEKLWDLYRIGAIEKEILRDLRFALTLKDFGIDDPELAREIGDYYLEESPRKVNLFPYSRELLQYLQPNYKLHLITNGFSEVQDIKLRSSRLDQYFEKVITSEDAGVKKPDPGIFMYAFEQTGAQPGDSLMIGDDVPIDIEGARQVGMDQALFDPDGIHPPETGTIYVRGLQELKSWL